MLNVRVGASYVCKRDAEGPKHFQPCRGAVGPVKDEEAWANVSVSHSPREARAIDK